ncbi:MAG: helix-turn-helix domain-containing protein [Bacilli bacterium]|jgi:DNA-binding XRE family transcriptional regulator|nr:helix-turn-helix domain-containing protein [Bacilli bacterium]
MIWSEQIHFLRQKLLITQTELAKMIGVSYVSINRWENGHFEPTMKAKRALMKLFVENGIVEDK